MWRTNLLFVVILSLTGCQPAMNHAIPDRESRVRTYIRSVLASGKSPGLQYLLLSADSILFSHCGGSADIASHRPMDPHTTMMFYSMTKTITAAAVLQLVERGVIRLDDPLRKYLPDIPYGDELKIRHLLSQTSGIPNPIPLRWVHLVSEHQGFDEQAALRDILRRNDELEFPPGERYAYANISSWLLGALIRAVTGDSYEEYVRVNVIRRLGIPETEMDFTIPSPGLHAKGYLPEISLMNMFKALFIDGKYVGDYEDDWLHIKEHYLNGPAFGGLVGTSRALGIFLQDMLKPESGLLGNDTRAKFFEQQVSNSGEPVPMTLGWHVSSEDGVRYFFKEGGGGGFHCEMRIYPAQSVASVVLSNSTEFDVDGFLSTADKEFFTVP